MPIILKSEDEVALIRMNASLLASIIKDAEALLFPGISTRRINEYIHQRITTAGAVPSLLGYEFIGPKNFRVDQEPVPYPFATCISVNDEVNWGVPSEKLLREGDLVTLEAGIYKDGFHSEAEYTYGVGRLDAKTERLLLASRIALQNAIEVARVGNRLAGVSFAIQQVATSYGYSVVREFVGHGIGRFLVEEPQIPCYGRGEGGPILRPGMVLHVVALVKETPSPITYSANGITAITADGSSSCTNGHVIVVGQSGPEILTPGPWEREERPPLIEAVTAVSTQLITYLKKHPEALYRLDPHVFEKLVGEILASFGFALEFNVRTISGEVDIVGFTKDILGNSVGYVVECKRYSTGRRVRLAEVTRLQGIKETLKQTYGVDRGLFVTTSDFTRDAQVMGKRWDLDLRNCSAVVDWLKAYKVSEDDLYLPFLCS